MTPLLYTLFLAFSWGVCFPVDAAPEKKEPIQGLLWKAGPVRVIRTKGFREAMVQLGGFFQREGWQIYFSDLPLPVNREGEFSLLVPITLNRVSFSLKAVGPTRESQTENFEIVVNVPAREIAQAKSEHWMERKLRNLSAGASVGMSWVSYQQTSLSTVQETNLTPKLSLSYALSPRQWLLEGEAYLSAMTFSNPASTGKGLKFYGGDLRVGYQIPFENTPLALTVYGGFYLMSTFGTSYVGYTGVAGPELYPALQYRFLSGALVSFYGKYSPIMNDLSILGLSNAVLGGGAAYFSKPIEGGFLRGVLYGLSLELSRLKLEMTEVRTQVTTYTLGAHLVF